MIIFINDRPVQISQMKKARELSANPHFDHIIDARLSSIKGSDFHGHVLVLNATAITAEKVFNFLNNTDFAELQSLTILANDEMAVEERIKKMYTIVKAAGGVVQKNDSILLMLRRGKWDLPKGKLDNDEKSRKAALREVQEETGVVAELGEKLCVTWHTYTMNNKMILKRTKWYTMTCADDSQMKPQAEEDITALNWFTESDVKKAMVNSFSSIRYVVDCYFKKAPIVL